MVEEKFKIGIDIEVDESGLDAAARKIQNAFAAAAQKGVAAGGAPPTGAAGRPAAPAGGVAVSTAKSIREALSVGAKDIAKQIQQAFSQGVSDFEQITKRAEAAAAQLAKATGTAPVKPAAGRARDRATTEVVEQAPAPLAPKGKKAGQVERAATKEDVARLRKLSALRERGAQGLTKQAQAVVDKPKEAGPLLAAAEKELKAANRLLAVANKLEQLLKPVQGPTPSPVDREISNQVGGSNKEGSRERKARKDESRTLDTGETKAIGSGRSGVQKKDRPGGDVKEEKRKAARNQGPEAVRAGEAMAAQQAYMEQEATRAAESLRHLTNVIESIPEFKGQGPKFLEKAGLPSPEAVGVQGGAVVLKTLSGELKVITSYSKSFGDSVERFNKISQNIETLISTPAGEGGGSRLQEIGRKITRSPGLGLTQLREEMKGVTEGLPTLPEGKPLAGFAMGGQAEHTIKLTAAQSDLISKINDEAGKVAAINVILDQIIRNRSAEVNEAQGIQKLTSAGLTEATAADVDFRKDPETKKIIEVQLNLQTRALAEMGVGGEGAVSQYRMAQVMQALQTVGGGRADIEGAGEKAAYEAGVFPGQGVTTPLRTVAMGAAQEPIIGEDEIMVDKGVVMDAIRMRSEVMNTLAEGLKVGQKLTEGQVMGQDIDEEDIKFDPKGIAAEVTKIEKVMIDGIEGYRIMIQELDPLATGAKLSTLGGMKGIVSVSKEVGSLARETGTPEGTQAVISMAGMVKRGDLRDAIMMISSTISEKAEVTSQDVADQIVAAMKEGGLDIVEAAQKVSQGLGLEGVPTTAVPAGGKLEKAGVKELMSGVLPFIRIGTEGTEGPREIKERFVSQTDMQALKLRAETVGFFEDATEGMRRLTAANTDFGEQINALIGDTAALTEKLRALYPEEIKEMPSGAARPEEFAGTLYDPESLREAFKLMVPTRGGGEEPFRIPGQGPGIGQRGGYRGKTGALAPDLITKQVEKVRVTAEQIRGARGEIPMEQGSKAASEGAEMVNRFINDTIDAISKVGIDAEEGAAKAKMLKDALMPLVEQLEGLHEIKFRRRLKGGKLGEPERAPGGTAAGYVAAQAKRGGPMAELLGMRDVLAMRTKGPADKPTVSVPGKGALYKDPEMLQKAMSGLNIKLEESSDHVQKLYTRMEKFVKELKAMYAVLSFGRAAQGAAPGKRRMAQQVGGGVKETAFLTAVQVPTGVNKELEQARTALMRLKESGANVSAALEALERTAALQPEAGVARDVIIMSKADYEARLESLVKRGMARGEAEVAMEKGLVHREPTTGGASYMQAKILKDLTGEMPAGKVGIPGPFPISSKEDYGAMMAPMEKEQARLVAVIREGGDAAAAARAELGPLNTLVNSLQRSFRALTLNLDFDGDQVEILTRTYRKLGASARDTEADVKAVGLNLREMMANIVGATTGTETGGVEQFASLFEQGQARLRPTKELQRAALMPQTPETMGAEAKKLVGGKMGIGLVSDAYNKVSMAALAGIEQVGQSVATGVERLMLLINKPLGGAGSQGPLGFTEDLRKGKLETIFKGMESGKGVYGELGNFEKQMRAQMEPIMQAMDPEAILKIAGGEGVGAKDVQGAIQGLLDKWGLKSTIKQIYEMLKENMREALQQSGLSPEEVEQEMGALLKGPKAPGIPVERLLPKAYGATRRKEAERLSELPVEEQLRTAKKMMEEEPAKLVMAEMEEEPLNLAGLNKNLRKLIKSWLKDIKGQYKAVSLKGMATELGASPADVKGAAGALRPPQEPGGESTILISVEKRIEKVNEALRILRAGGPKTAEEINKVTDAFTAFGTTIAHESIHKANKERTKSVNELNTALMKGTGIMGKARGQLLAKFTREGTGVSNVRKPFQQWEKIKEARARGEKTVTLGEGEKPVKATRKLERQYRAATYKILAEELMAHLADRERWMKIMKSGEAESGEVAAPVLGAIEGLVAELIEKKPKMIKGAMDFAQEMEETRTALLESLLLAAEGEGTDPARVQKATAARAATLGGPFRPQREEAREKILAIEQAVTAGKKRFKVPEEIQLPPGVEGEDVSEKMRKVGKKMRDLLEAAGDAAGDPGKIRGIEAEIRAAGREYADGLAAMRRGVGNADKLPGITGFEEENKLMRQFRARVAEAKLQHIKDLDANIAAAVEAGDTGSQELRDKMKALQLALLEFAEYGVETMKLQGRGKGMAPASLFATAEGAILPEAQAAGMAFQPKHFQQLIQSVAGEGKEAERFKPMEKPLARVVDMISQGKDATEAWIVVFKALTERPEAFTTNMEKVQYLMARFSKMAKGAPVGEASQQYEVLTRNVRLLANAFKKLGDVGTAEKLQAALGGLKGEPAAIAARGVGRELGPSMAQQSKDFKAAAEQQRERYQKLVGTEAYEEAGAPKIFEPMAKDIIDPATGKAAIKLGVEFRRVGKTIKMSMRQAGAATQAFGNQMRNAFRRVVQWGFASGIIYGTIRALRNMVQVVTEVETKMANLKKVMDTSITNFDKMQEGAVGLAKNFGIAIDEVLEGMVVYAQQGLKMNEIMERTRATMMAVNVTTLSTTEATEALTAVMKLFSTEMDSSMSAVDAWSAVAAKHAITAKDLAMAIQRSGAAAKTAGVSFNDLLGMTTAIGAVTRQTGKEVATSIKFMMRAMRRPTAQKQLVQMGVMQEDPTGNMKPAMDVLGGVANKWDDLTRAQQLSTAQAMAGIRHYNAFIVLMENWEEALDASADAQNSQGFAARKNIETMKTFSKNMQVLRETVKGFALDIGKIVLPAMTGLTQLASVAIGAFEVLPDIVKQAGVGLAIGLVAFHKVTDMILDSMDAITGYGRGAKEAIKKKGMIPSMLEGIRNLPENARAAAKGVAGAFKGMGAAVILPTVAGDALDAKTVKNLQGAMDALRFQNAAQGAGMFANAMYAARTAVANFAKAVVASNVAIASTVVGIALLAGAAIAGGIAYSRMSKSGKEMEDQMFDQIGTIKDSINSLEAQGTKLSKVSHLWKKYESALRKASDPQKLAVSIDAGTFKSPLKALQKYKDTIVEVGVAMATVDPSGIEGISKTGEYIYTASEGMNALSTSAIDAKKATIAAMNVQAIVAYGKEITEAQGFWNNFVEAVTGFTVDMSLLKQLADAREKINELAQAREELAGKGIASLHLQNDMNDAVEKELEIRSEVLASVGSMLRMLDQMPTFANEELAQTVLNGEKMTKALEALVLSGGAGREATVGSVKMRQMARNVGLGGQVGMESTVNADRLREALLEQGLKAGRQGGPKEEGDLGFLSTEAAERVAILTDGLERFNKVKNPKAAIDAARTVFTGMDPSGELIYYWTNAVDGGLEKLRESEMSEEMAAIFADMATIDHTQVEAAAEKTRKLLTIQSAGALAGIRVPEGGMPQIGPGMRRELTVEQRVMGRLPEEMQRMATVQSELTEIAKKYNEEIGEGKEIGENAASAMKQNFKTMTQASKQLAATLQMENFDLAVLAHVTSAMYKLEMSLEAAATAARDAAIEEETRAELLKHTAGAMAGLAVAPQMDMGKTFRELSAQERLQKEVPGLGKTFQKVGAAEKQYETRIQTVIDIRKQIADFGEMLGDLEGSRKALTAQQKLSLTAEVEGVDTGDVYIADQIAKSASEQLAELKHQTPLLDRMLEALGVLGEVIAEEDPKEKKTRLQEGMSKLKGRDLIKLLGGAGSKTLNTFFEDIIGLQQVPKEEQGSKAIPDFIKRQTPNIEFESPESEARFKGIAAKLEEQYQELAKTRWMDQKAMFPSHKEGETTPALDKIKEQIDELNDELLGLPEVVKKLKRMATIIASREAKTKEELETRKSLLAREKLIADIAKMKKEAMSKLIGAQTDALASTEETRRLLETKKGWAMALAAQSLVQAMESTIEGFKKTEMMFYDKISSDIEGPFARVGQPGFRDPFETKRREVQEKYGGGMRPMSYEDMQARDKELRDIDFDEKEARIKQTQDKEVAALRAQQSQAEKMRDVLADAMLKGDIGPETAGMAKNFFDTLTSQLAASEQARMEGGELTFKGVPALEDARNFLQKIQQQAAAEAKKADKAFQIAIGKESGKPQVEAMHRAATEIVAAIDRLPHDVAGAAAGRGPAGRAVLGLPAGPAPGFIGPPTREEMARRVAGDQARVNAAAAGAGQGQTAQAAAADGIMRPVGDPIGQVITPEEIARGNREYKEMLARQAPTAAELAQVALNDAVVEIERQGYNRIAQEGPGPARLDLGTQLAGVGPGAPAMYAGKARQYTGRTRDEDMFGREQTFKAAGGVGDPTLTIAEKIMSHTEALATGKYKTIAAAGELGLGGQTKFTDADLARIFGGQTRAPTPYVPHGTPPGAPGVLAAQTEGIRSGPPLGNAAARLGASTVSVEGETPGDPTQQRQEPTSADGEASQAIATAIEALNGTLSTLSTQGITLPSDFTSSLEGIGKGLSDTIADKTLKVDITSSITLPVTVNNISEIGTAAATTVADGGAAVLEGFERRITAVQASIVDIVNEQIDDVLPTGAALTENVEGIGNDVNDLRGRVDTLEGTDAEQTRKIDQAIADSSGVQEDLSEFEERIADGQTLIADAARKVDQFDSEILDLEIRVINVEGIAASAEATSIEVRESLTALATELRAADQSIRASIRDINTKVEENAGLINVNVDNIRRLRTDMGTVTNIAHNARNAATPARNV